MPGRKTIDAKHQNEKYKDSKEEQNDLVLLGPEDHPGDERGALAQPRLHVTQPAT